MTKQTKTDRNASSVPTFHDPALRDAVEAVKKPVTDYLFRLDQISEDIKSAERWLTEHGANIETWIMDAASDDLSALTVGQHGCRYSLGWAYCEKEDRFRIMYRETRGYEHPVEGYQRSGFEKPFLECGAAERLARAWLLPHVVTSLGTALTPAHERTAPDVPAPDQAEEAISSADEDTPF